MRRPWSIERTPRSRSSRRGPTTPAVLDPVQQTLLLGASCIGLRTRFVDDEVTSSALGQVVTLGSGLDTRAWRLRLPPDTTAFELDSAEVVDFMTAAMLDVPATVRRVPLVADVTMPWAASLVRSGFHPDRPTMWVLEGLLPYLGADDQRAVLDDVQHLSSPGSRAVIERAVALDTTAMAQERLEDFSRLTGLPMDQVLARSDPPDPARLLAASGWEVTTTSVADLEHRYGRPLSSDGTPTDPSSRAGFVTALRRTR